MSVTYRERTLEETVDLHVMIVVANAARAASNPRPCGGNSTVCRGALVRALVSQPRVDGRALALMPPIDILDNVAAARRSLRAISKAEREAEEREDASMR